MSPEVQSRLGHALRVWLSLAVALAAIPTYLAIRDRRFVHWLNTDSVQVTATVITYNRPLLIYSYAIGQRNYEGRVKTATPFNRGDEFEVFVSASHPWMSSIRKPPLVFQVGQTFGMVALIALVLLVCILASWWDDRSILSGNSAPRNSPAREFPEPPARG
jgi:hypothetical protein